MNTYEGGLAEQSVTHFYGGVGSTPKKQNLHKGKKMACKSKKPKKK